MPAQKKCDKLHVPDDLLVLWLDFGSDASYLTINHSSCNSERSNDAVTFKPYSSLNQYSLSNIKDEVPSLPIRALLVLER